VDPYSFIAVAYLVIDHTDLEDLQDLLVLLDHLLVLLVPE